MTTYTSPFTGNAIQPTDVSYALVDLSGTLQLYWPQYANADEQAVARIMDVYAESASDILVLPDATQASLGQDILIRNLGSFDFTVQKFDGSGSFLIPVNQSYYTYLTNNDSQAGTWNQVAFAAGTSFADAATLAGNSTIALQGKLEVALTTNEYTDPPTLSSTSRGKCFVWTGGAGTFQLPAVANINYGWFISVRNNGTGSLTITTASPSSTIDGFESIVLPLGDSCFICVNKDPAKQDFFTVGRSRPNSLTFSSATYDVDVVAGDSLNLVSNTPIIQRYTALSGTRTTPLLVELPAVTQVYYLINDTNQNGYDMTFQVLGSSQDPLVLPNGAQAIVLSDGDSLYAMVQTAVGTVVVGPGSAAVPSYSFSTDTSTGMYLANPGQLGFSSLGTNIAVFDATGGPGNFVSTFQGQVVAGLISGGTF
jgi:hypothetical protein